MANLVIDIGNTALKAAWTEGSALGKTFRYQGEKAVEFILTLTLKEKPDVMAVSSAREISPRHRQMLERECGTLVLMGPGASTENTRFGLPEHLAADRAASIIAARRLFGGKSCTIFDFGTTLTIDFIDSEGRYGGGNISPGCRTRFKAINRYSKSLPLVDTPETVDETGMSTVSSICSGIIKGMMFEIAGYMSMRPENTVVFTGGDAIYFAKRMKNSIFVVCNLVLMGLSLIADEYEGKSK